jgi:hypothetical protein
MSLDYQRPSSIMKTNKQRKLQNNASPRTHALAEANFISRQIHSETLIECGLDFSQLSHFMELIIQVVNQHAKLLD